MMKSPEFQFNESENVQENPEYLSQEGFERLQKKLEGLRTYRQEIAKLLEETKEDGDLTENSGYQDAGERWQKNENQIAELENILSRAVPIENEKSADIKPGSTVILKKEGSEAEIKYSLVGATEADPLNGKISNKSPLGLSLIGKEKGDTVEVVTPGGKIKYTIINVG